MTRYGRWQRINRDSDPHTQEIMVMTLGRGLCRELGLADDAYTWWEPELEYGREKLGLDEGEIALGAVAEKP